jgi:hypothetical protein
MLVVHVIALIQGIGKNIGDKSKPCVCVSITMRSKASHISEWVSMIRSGNQNLLIGWKDAVTAIGRPRLYSHDFGTRETLSRRKSMAGTKDLMSRMG